VVAGGAAAISFSAVFWLGNPEPYGCLRPLPLLLIITISILTVSVKRVYLQNLM
jgi:hypothetical protein